MKLLMAKLNLNKVSPNRGLVSFVAFLKYCFSTTAAAKCMDRNKKHRLPHADVLFD